MVKKSLLNGWLRRRENEAEKQTHKIKEYIMALIDQVNKAMAELDTMANEHSADEAEIASLKSQLDAANAAKLKAEADLAAITVSANSTAAVAAQAAADVAAVQPLLDKIDAMAAPAPVAAPVV